MQPMLDTSAAARREKNRYLSAEEYRMHQDKKDLYLIVGLFILASFASIAVLLS